jgi:hypothetical protein
LLPSLRRNTLRIRFSAGPTIMATRTVRLDDEAETTLERLRRITGLSISEVLKRGLAAYETQALAETSRRPYDIYRALDLGPGGYAAAPARDAKSAVSDAIRRKHGR